MEQYSVPCYGDAESSQSRFENLPPLFKTLSKKKPKKTRKLPSFCVFCKNNNEAESVYSSHVLKDPDGKVVCPALYIYKCPICNNTGHEAHTVKHCPYNPEQLRRQTELAEIWRSYRETSHTSNREDNGGYGGYHRTPLTNTTRYNVEANRIPQRQSLSPSFGSLSPASSCTSPSPLLSPNRSFFTSFPSSPTSPSSSYNYPASPPALPPTSITSTTATDENNILMENLIKLLQVSN